MNTNTGSMQTQLFQLYQNLGGVVLPGQNSNSYSSQGWLAQINSLVEGGIGLGNSVLQSVTYSDGGTSTIEADTGVFFALTSNGTSTTISVSNVPTSGTRYGLELHLIWTAGAITFPASWSKGDTLPSATGNYVITAVTIDGGTSFKIAVLTE